jgi:hypothetical protein
MTKNTLAIVEKHAQAFERFHPRSLSLRGLSEDLAYYACEKLVQSGKLTRVLMWNQVWYFVSSRYPAESHLLKSGFTSTLTTRNFCNSRALPPQKSRSGSSS